MRETKGNIFEMFETGEYDAICITTNGIIKKNGEAVMGAGVALEATRRFKGIAKILAEQLNKGGNKVHAIGKTEDGLIISFPTKNHWRDNSDIELIKKSASELMNGIIKQDFKNVLITRMGCGNGGLQWDYVKSQVDHILDERVIVVDNN